ncbi:hypothetical protein BFC19_11010 [Brochothrix thermosphacta]|nr:hypothetical protein BFC19_11010 [Brochothrix thermosphacta]
MMHTEPNNQKWAYFKRLKIAGGGAFVCMNNISICGTTKACKTKITPLSSTKRTAGYWMKRRINCVCCNWKFNPSAQFLSVSVNCKCVWAKCSCEQIIAGKCNVSKHRSKLAPFVSSFFKLAKKIACCGWIRVRKAKA